MTGTTIRAEPVKSTPVSWGNSNLVPINWEDLPPTSWKATTAKVDVERVNPSITSSVASETTASRWRLRAVGR